MTDYPSYQRQEAAPIVYVRAVRTADLPSRVREQVGDLDQVWTISDQDGDLIALADNREKAFTMARLHEMAPVSVH